MAFPSRSIASLALAIVVASTVAACAGPISTQTASTGKASPSAAAPRSGSPSAAPATSAPAGSPGPSAKASANGPSVVIGPSKGPGPSASVVPTDSAGSPGPSSLPSVSPAPSTACITGLPLAHLDPVLEAYLPCIIGGVSLERFSWKLSSYIAQTTGGDRDLYAPWLGEFGLTPDDVVMAVASDQTGQENFVVHAIQVPSVPDDKLASSFADQAKKAGWPVTPKTVVSRNVLEMSDPAAKAAGALAVGYVWAKDHILYTIITDSSSLLVEGLIKLP